MGRHSKTNIASGRDRVAMQIGHVLGSKSSKPATPAEDATATNVRSSNATVGKQVDAVIDDVRIRR